MTLNTFLVSAILLLSGCATQQQEIRVEKLPEPPVITVPELAIHKLTETSPVDEVVQAYYETIVRLQGALEEALAALEVYRGR